METWVRGFYQSQSAESLFQSHWNLTSIYNVSFYISVIMFWKWVSESLTTNLLNMDTFVGLVLHKSVYKPDVTVWLRSILEPDQINGRGWYISWY